MEENRLLGPLTTLGIGGPARWYAEAGSEEELVEAAGWARARELRLFVLGGGSNLLISDAGFDGLVLRVGLRGMETREPERHQPAGKRIYRVAAGEDWNGFVQRAVEDNCAGIECLAGIPGTVGGTPVQNVGAYGQEVSATICGVRVLDLAEGAFREFSNAACGFGYRRSRFNTDDRGRYIVTRVDYRLTPGGAPAVRYPELQRAVEAEGGAATLRSVAAAVRRLRQAKGMLLVDGDPDCRSAGSFFKNPVVSADRFGQIAAHAGKEPPWFPVESGAKDEGRVKIPAAWLIEQAGFARGYALGNAGISSRHTLALINRGGATAAEMVALASEIRDRVAARFAVELEMEPVRVGF